ncbi:MAG: hypothetical protein ACOCZP_02645 [Candidatus Hadarchaeota archaeon]
MVLEKIKKLFSGKEKKEEKKKIQNITVEEAKKKIKEEKERIKNKKLDEMGPIIRDIDNLKVKIDEFTEEFKNAQSKEKVHPSIRKTANEARRLFLKKIDRAEQKIKTPEAPDWGDLLEIKNSLGEVINLLNNARSSHGQQINALYETELRKFHNLLKKLQDYHQKISPELSNVNSKIENLNDTSDRIKSIDRLKSKKNSLKSKIKNLREKKEKKKEKISEKRNSLKSLKKSDRHRELEEMKRDIEELSKKRDNYLSRIKSEIKDLDRPLRKLNKMIERKEEMVSKEVMDGINSYLNDPVKAALSESEGFPNLKATLKELNEVLPDKMNLDRRERNKHLNKVEKLLEENVILNLRKKYQKTEKEIKELKEEIENSSLLSKKSRLENEIEKLESEIEKINADIDKTDKEISKTEKEIKKKSEKVKRKFKGIFDLKIKDL